MSTNRSYQESELLSSIAAGDEAAFKQLYDTFYADLYYFAESIIGNPTQSQDIVVVAFTHLWNRRAGFSAMSSVKGFLYITVKNDCLKYLQKLSTRAKHEDAIMHQLESDADFAENRIIAAEVMQRLHERINELSPNYREVIQLLFIEELSIAEAAARLRITQENLRKRKERALEQLRLKLVKDALHPLLLFYLMAGTHSL